LIVKEKVSVSYGQTGRRNVVSGKSDSKDTLVLDFRQQHYQMYC
jgi:hypothetical protein